MASVARLATQFRSASIAISGAVFLCSFAGTVRAQNFPDRPVTVYNAFRPGGASDIALRALAEGASKYLRQRVIVDSKPGGSGTLAATSVMNAKPDGYLLAQAPVYILRMPHMGAKYDPRTDLTWIIAIVGSRQGLSVRADAPWKTWQQFIDYARANPGRISYATAGIGTNVHIALEDIAEHQGVKWVHVPYKGAIDGALAVRSGEVQAVAGTPPWSLIESGQLRVLVMFTEERSRRAPEVPTLKELGYPTPPPAPWGFVGPKGMPGPVVKILHDAFKQAMSDSFFQKAIERTDQVPMYMSSEDYAKYAREEYDREKIIVKRFGLKKN